MKLIVNSSTLKGAVTVPGSKSHSIRALAVAAMASGRSYIRYPLESEDTLSGMHAAQMLGATVVSKTADLWVIDGIGGKIQVPDTEIDLGNSGTSLRIFTALAALGSAQIGFDGDASLRTRLMAPLLTSLHNLGANFTAPTGKCPFTIQGPLHGGKTTLKATSSQLLTALLFAAPLIPEGEVEIILTELHEKPYVLMTLDWLNFQGIRYEMLGEMMYFKIPCGQSYAAFDKVIPADFSTATFPLIASLVTRSPLTIKNLDFSDSQGDKAVFDIARQFGAMITRDGNETYVVPPPGKLHGIPELSLNDTPDALPALSVLACFADGPTRIVNTPQARIKETDRIASMTAELRKMGALIEELPDGMIITPSPCGLHGAEVNGYGDHRIVMSLAIAGLAAQGETIISTAESAAVTYPAFISDFTDLGADFKTLD